jgi:DNA topoisomerase-1
MPSYSDEEEETFTDEEVIPKKRKAPSTKKGKKAVKGKSKRRRNDSDSDGDNSDSSGSEKSSDSDNDSNSSSVESDDEPVVKKEKLTKTNSITSRTTSTSSREGKPVRVKKETDIKDRLEEARKAFKWWEAKDLPEGINWRVLEHAGVIFAPDHVRHNVPLLYEGVPVELNDEQEELATFYASIPDDGPQLGNPKTREVFQKNFFDDFKATLPPGHVVKKFSKCDFSRIKNHLELQKSLKKAATDQEKALRKEIKATQFLRHGYALIDGRMEKVVILVLILMIV